MNLAAEQNRPVPASEPRKSPSSIPGGGLILHIALPLALMATAANCFLKYLWWTACYSAWSGIPKMAAQWRSAGIRSSFYGWSVILVELAVLVLLYTAIRLPKTLSTTLRTAMRLAASLTIALIGTAVLALILSWIKQSH